MANFWIVGKPLVTIGRAGVMHLSRDTIAPARSLS